MEQLLVQADSLHREVALLSNKLHQYADTDVEGVKPIILKIITTRDEWKKVRAKIDYFEKTGKLPEEIQEQPTDIIQNDAAISELKLEVARINTLISKAKKKLELTPDHKKAVQWREDLAKLEALKNELRTKIINKTYAAES